MKKQKLYVGNTAHKGIQGKRVMIIGHQCHATEKDKLNKNNPNWEYDYLKNCQNQNDKLIEAVKRGFVEENGDSWGGRDHISYLRFARIMTGNRNLNKDDTDFKSFWESIAFGNLLQVPDVNLSLRCGRDKSELYVEGQTAVKDYIKEYKPSVIIVWGTYAYPYVIHIDNRYKIINNHHCTIFEAEVGEIHIIRIVHPCRAGYDDTRRRIKEVLDI